MMKIATLFLIFLSLSCSQAKLKEKAQQTESKGENKKGRVVFSLEFADINRNHKYKMIKYNNKYILAFQDQFRSTKKIKVDENRAEAITSEVNQLLWANQYRRRPSSTKTCRDYMIIRMNKERTGLCESNIKLVGRAYGLLNSLQALF